MIYFNNAADSYPKLASIHKFLGDSNYLSTGRECKCITSSQDIVTEKFRSNLLEFLNVPDDYQVTITNGATESANLIIQSFYKQSIPDSQVIFDFGCHNSVIRPLYELYGSNRLIIHKHQFLDPCQFDESSIGDISQIAKNIQMMIFSYQSNVLGNYYSNPQDIFKFIESNKMSNTALVFDITQAIGNCKIDVTNILGDYKDKFHNLYLFGTFHKSMASICGCGFVIHPKNHCLKPLIYGGTGTVTYDYKQPTDYPHYLESGTHNVMAIKCAIISIDFARTFLEEKQKSKAFLVDYFWNRYQKVEQDNKILEKYFFLQTNNVNNESGIINLIPYETAIGESIASRLYQKYKIITRFGCHCCPLFYFYRNGIEYHQSLRISFSEFNTTGEIDMFLIALCDCIFDIEMEKKV